MCILLPIMKPNDENEGETPFASTSPLPKKQELAEGNLSAKRIKLTPEGVNQADVDAVLKRLAAMRKRLREDILFIGGKLHKMRAEIRYGSWGAWCERTFPLSIKTANIWIRAWESRDSELAVSDWDAYMRILYGNEPKKLTGGAPSWRAQERSEDDEQSGGEGFGEGFTEVGEPPIFAGKGKVGFHGFKNLVGMLDREFFQSKEITREAKQEFITQLINWLENQRKNIRD
jgi:hypothetical protein